MMRGEERKSQFKKQSDLENGRRRREETSTQLRKAKREEQLMKRRQAVQPTPTTKGDGDDKAYVYTTKDIPQLMSVFAHGTPTEDDLLKTLQGFRRMLSVEANPPVSEVLAAGAMPYFSRLLHQNENPTIVFEAAWTLTNIASTDKTEAVVEAGVMDQLVKLLYHEQAQIREQAAWCLGNIAGDSSRLRDTVLHHDALKGLIMNLNEPESMSLLSNVAWAVSNLCRGKPSPQMELISPAIAPLSTLLRRDVGHEVVVDAVWALSYLADGDNDRISAVMATDPGLTQNLVDRLVVNELSLLTPLVRTLGNFVTGTDEQTQAVVDAGVIKHMERLLNHGNKNIRKESCWLLSNVAAGSMSQLEAVLKEQGLMERVVEVARNDRWEVRKEAIWVISNMLTTGKDYHVRNLVQRDGFAALIQALVDVRDTKVLLVVLEATEVVLKLGQELGLNYAHIFDELNGLDKLEDLQEHPENAIYEASLSILEKYFGAEDEEDENIAPTQNENGMFGFGASAPAKQLFPEAENDTHAPLGQSNAPFDFSASMQH